MTTKRASMREGPLAELFRRTQNEDQTATSSAAVTPSAPERLREAFELTKDTSLAEELNQLEAATLFDTTKPVHAKSSPIAAVTHPVIRVVGVGGAGVNAIDRMVEAGVVGVEFLAFNTDQQSLANSLADVKLHIGADKTRGLGAGAEPEVGYEAAKDSSDRIKSLLKGADMVFVAAGAGGGTGTGAAPMIARIARELGALTVGIVTRPFGFEGKRRADQAELGIQTLAEEVDTLIVIPNNRLLSILDKRTSMVDAFRVADDVLRQGVQGISDLVTLPGLINLDFADVRTVMSDAGDALLGIGMSSGEDRAKEAIGHAIESPLLETRIEGARSILLSIVGGPDLSLWEVNEAARLVADTAHPDANIIFGATVDEALTDQMWVTIVATGHHRHAERERTSRQVGSTRENRRDLTERGSSRTREQRVRRDDDFDIPDFTLPR